MGVCIQNTEILKIRIRVLYYEIIYTNIYVLYVIFLVEVGLDLHY